MIFLRTLRELRPPPHKLTAVFYFSAVLIYGVRAFPNFSAVEVVATLLLFSALPLGLLFLGGDRKASSVSKSSPLVLASFFMGLFLFVVHSSSLLIWSDYYSNFSYERLENQGGYHNDSVFHVSIIQGIMRSGYPTTGQHLEPLLQYHSLSHYVDAIVLALLGLDPWASYALLFFAKGAAVMLGLILLSSRISQVLSVAGFFVILGIIALAFTASWDVVGSHGQWLPVLILIISSSWLGKLLDLEILNFKQFTMVTLLVLLIGLGKISLGFSLAVLVGILLLFRFWRDWKVYFFWSHMGSFLCHFWLFLQWRI